jgi:hypothetical protein
MTIRRGNRFEEMGGEELTGGGGFHGDTARPVGNGGAGLMAGSRRSENWSTGSGVLWRSCCWGRWGWRTAGEGYR